MSGIDLNKAVTWFFYMVISASATLVTANLSTISNSVQKLNEHMAVVLDRQIRHKERLDQYDKRLNQLEQPGNR